MPYELLVLDKQWFLSDLNPEKFLLLSQIINKGYSKPMAQYGIIETPRIHDHHQFLESLQLDSRSRKEFEDKTSKFTFMLLLGSKPDFARLKKKGFTRKFDSQIWPLSASKRSDIPLQWVDEFGVLNSKTVDHVYLSPSDLLEEDVADRVLATIALKTYDNDGYFSLLDILPHIKHLEITAFTSFMRGAGTALLDHVILEFLSRKNSTLLQENNVEKVVLHAVVVKDHELVPYYEQKCNFTRTTRPEEFYDFSSMDSPLHNGFKAVLPFTVSYLRRDISISN